MICKRCGKEEDTHSKFFSEYGCEKDEIGCTILIAITWMVFILCSVVNP